MFVLIGKKTQSNSKKMQTSVHASIQIKIVHKFLYCDVKIYYDITQAYTSQFVAFVMFALMMSEDRVSKRERYNDIYQALQELPGNLI